MFCSFVYIVFQYEMGHRYFAHNFFFFIVVEIVINLVRNTFALCAILKVFYESLAQQFFFVFIVKVFTFMQILLEMCDFKGVSYAV